MLQEKIIFLLKQIKPYEEIQDDTELIRNNIISSMELFELVFLIEIEFNIEIDEEQIVPDNFVTIKAIENLITRLLKF
jgi:acyl carrier protein